MLLSKKWGNFHTKNNCYLKKYDFLWIFDEISFVYEFFNVKGDPIYCKSLK
jgi:hypothetical protein